MNPLDVRKFVSQVLDTLPQVVYSRGMKKTTTRENEMQEQYGQEMAFGDSAEEAASELAEILGLGITLRIGKSGRAFKSGETKIWTWKISTSGRHAARVDLA